MRVIFTGFDENSFADGYDWALGQSGQLRLVIDMGLNKEQVASLEELGVVVAVNSKKTGIPQVDLFNTFLSFVGNDHWSMLRPPGKYLFWDVAVKKVANIEDLWGFEKLVAPKLKEIDVKKLVFSLFSIDLRLKLGYSFESYLRDGLRYSGLIAGDLPAWRAFVGFYNSLFESKLVGNTAQARDTALNWFALYFDTECSSETGYEF